MKKRVVSLFLIIAIALLPCLGLIGSVFGLTNTSNVSDEDYATADDYLGVEEYSPEEDILTVPEDSVINTTPNLIPPSQNITSPQSSTANALSNSAETSIAFIGCAVTTSAINGYYSIGGNTLWPTNGTYYGSGTVDVWYNQIPMMESYNNRWTKYKNLQLLHKNTNKVWWQLCPGINSSTTSYEEVLAVYAKILEKSPGKEIYVSTTPARTNSFCTIEDPSGSAVFQKYVDKLVAEGKAKAGPVLTPLSEAQLSGDGCMANQAGEEAWGNTLFSFFDNGRTPVRPTYSNSSLSINSSAPNSTSSNGTNANPSTSFPPINFSAGLNAPSNTNPDSSFSSDSISDQIGSSNDSLENGASSLNNLPDLGKSSASVEIDYKRLGAEISDAITTANSNSASSEEESGFFSSDNLLLIIISSALVLLIIFNLVLFFLLYSKFSSSNNNSGNSNGSKPMNILSDSSTKADSKGPGPYSNVEDSYIYNPINERLKAYVLDNLKRFSYNSVRTSLIQQGFTPEEIDEIYFEIRKDMDFEYHRKSKKK